MLPNLCSLQQRRMMNAARPCFVFTQFKRLLVFLEARYEAKAARVPGAPRGVGLSDVDLRVREHAGGQA